MEVSSTLFGMPASIAVFRALPGLGDLLCSIPALRALRAAFPESRLTLIGLPQAGFLLERFPAYVDELVEFPGYPGLVERVPPLEELPRFFSAMQGRRFDLLLQMHGSGVVTNPLVSLFGAARTAGFYLPGQFCPDERSFLPYPAEEAEVWRHLRLLEFLGLHLAGDALEFPLREEDHLALQALPEASLIEPGGYACVHPGASIARRCWQPERFARVADRLAEKGLRIVLTGSAAESPITRAVREAMRFEAIDLAGRTGLGALAALLSRARLLLCNDTGVSHLAAALKVPSVIIFIATAPARWAPLDRRRHRVVGEKTGQARAARTQRQIHIDVARERGSSPCPEQRCLREGCPVTDALTLAGLQEATVEAAVHEAEELLRKEHLDAAC